MAAIIKMDESLRARFAPTPAQVRAEWTKRGDQVRFQILPLLTRDMSLEPEASTLPSGLRLTDQTRPA